MSHTAYDGGCAGLADADVPIISSGISTGPVERKESEMFQAVCRRRITCRLLSTVVVFGVVLFCLAGAAFGQLSKADIEDLKQRAVDEGWTFTVDENPATQYSLDELCGLKPPPNWQEGARFVEFADKLDLPTRFDWRDSSGTTPIRNQGGCGSCWAFATVGPLECLIKIKDGITVDLSEQWLVSCNSNGWDCGGGWWAHDYHEFRTDPCDSTGAVYEAEFPYTATNGTCNCPYQHPYLIDNWAYIGNSYSVPSVDAIKQAIVTYGPVAVGISVNAAFQAYSGGIFNGCENGELNHGVVLVGWDDALGSGGVWIVRNSWGTGWGDGGYGYFPYGCSYIGYGASFVEYTGQMAVSFEYPNGVPTHLVSSQPTTFEVVTNPISGATLPGSGEVCYWIGEGAQQCVPMTETSLSHYDATLPAFDCGQQVSFRVYVEMLTGEIMSDPPDGERHLACVGDVATAVLDDDFESDLGWTVSGDAVAGLWERGIPVGGGDRGDPTNDYDGSGRCFLTGNTDGDSDVDDGTTYLTSPVFDLSSYDEAMISYARWFSNDFGSNPYEDVLEVWITDDAGATWEPVEVVGPTEQAAGGWYVNTFYVSVYAELTDQMQLRFDASDLINGSVVEAAIDAVTVTGYDCDGVPPPSITTTALPDWTAGYPYSQQLYASGGAGGYSWSDGDGGLTGSGLTLSTDGLLSGTPVGSGTISFTAVVTDDSSGTDEQPLSILVNDALDITSTACPEWTLGITYSCPTEAVGGTGGYTWRDKYSELPGTGLWVPTDGPIAGSPVVDTNVSFTLEVEDDIGATTDVIISISLNPAVSVTSDSLGLPAATQGEPYSQMLEASGGTGELTWINWLDDLDGTGLTLGADGLLSGTPSVVGDVYFTARASDEVGSDDTQGFYLECDEPYVCGDCNRDGKVNLSDVTILVDYVYLGGDAPDPLVAGNVDASPDGRINLSDITRVVDFVYLEGEDLECLD